MQGMIYYFNRIFLKIITPIPQRSIEHKLPNSPLHPQHGDGKREFRRPEASGAEDGVPTLVGVEWRHGTRSISTKISGIVAEKERLNIEGNKVEVTRG
jgi:hypothetical protein